MHDIVIIRVYFLHPVTFYCLEHLHGSYRLTDFRVLWLKRRVFASSTSFLWCKQNIFIFSPIFRQKTRNSLFSQCKTSIGNNSSSVEDITVTFAFESIRILMPVDRMKQKCFQITTLALPTSRSFQHIAPSVWNSHPGTKFLEALTESFQV